MSDAKKVLSLGLSQGTQPWDAELRGHEGCLLDAIAYFPFAVARFRSPFALYRFLPAILRLIRVPGPIYIVTFQRPCVLICGANCAQAVLYQVAGITGGRPHRRPFRPHFALSKSRPAVIRVPCAFSPGSWVLGGRWIPVRLAILDRESARAQQQQQAGKILYNPEIFAG